MIIFQVNVFDIQTINKERDCYHKENIAHRITGPVCKNVKQTHFYLFHAVRYIRRVQPVPGG